MCAMVFDTTSIYGEVSFLDLSGKDCLDSVLSDRQHNVLNENATTELKEVLAGEKTGHSVFLDAMKLNDDQCLFDPSCYVAGPEHEESVGYIERVS